MSRVWEIIESSRSHGQEEKITKAYECGYEEGYEDAMKDLQSQMGERSYRINDQYTGKNPGEWQEPMSQRGGSMDYRHESGYSGESGYREPMDYRSTMHSRMNERRMRDSMGRFK